MSAENLEQLEKDIYIVVKVEMREENVLGEVKWWGSLPKWVQRAVRGVWNVLCLAHDNRRPFQSIQPQSQLFNTQGEHACCIYLCRLCAEAEATSLTMPRCRQLPMRAE